MEDGVNVMAKRGEGEDCTAWNVPPMTMICPSRVEELGGPESCSDALYVIERIKRRKRTGSGKGTLEVLRG